MQFDSYRWQDHALNRHLWRIDLAVTALFLVAVFLGTALRMTGEPGHWNASANETMRTAMSRPQQVDPHPAALVDCDLDAAGPKPDRVTSVEQTRGALPMRSKARSAERAALGVRQDRRSAPSAVKGEA